MNQSYDIVSVKTRLVRFPLETPWGDAIQKFSALELPLVWVRDRGGNEGVGFGYTIGTGGSAALALLRDVLAPQLEGQDSRAVGAIYHGLRLSVHALTPGVIASIALAAIDVALWDLNAKRAEVPLYLWLGGGKKGVPIYNTHVGWLNRPLDEVLHLSECAVRRDGFTALKLKVGKKDPEEDEERVAKVRGAVGKGIALMIDANQSWTADEAVRRLQRLKIYDLTWIEEPCEATDFEGYRKIRQHCGIARAGGESLYSPAYFYQCAYSDVLDIFQPDVARLGGITPTLQVCGLAQAANLRVAPHVSPELSATVAAAFPNSYYIEYIPQMEPLLSEKVTIRDGLAIPSADPGHGIQFNDEALERYEVKDG